MARIEVKPAGFKKGVGSVWVELENIQDDDIVDIREYFSKQIESQDSVSDAFALAFVFAVQRCPRANPSDVWQHVIYRAALERGFSDQQWKRISGFALERALRAIYDERLAKHGLRIRPLGRRDAQEILWNLGFRGEIKHDKIDAIIERKASSSWSLFAGLHVKASLAERIQDDVPASVALMSKGILSILLTMDSKSFPPPHGDGVNYGELGGRNWENQEKARIKRQYIEEDGQFDALFSFNLRTPPSVAKTNSGKRIYTLGLFDSQPDQFVEFLVQPRQRNA